MENYPFRRATCSIFLSIALLAGCTEDEIERGKEMAEQAAETAHEKALEAASIAEEQLTPYLEKAKAEWNDGQSLDEAIESGAVHADGSTTIELCDLSASGLVDFVGGAATMGTVLPMVAGSGVQIIATAGFTMVSVVPVIDPSLTSAAATIAVMYGALKVYCAKDQILGNQDIREFVALVNEYAEKSEEALQTAYAALQAQLDGA